MFLDVRDPWPPVPPSAPEPGKPVLDKRRQRVVGLVVAINLGLVLLSPIAGSSVAQAVVFIIRRLYR